MSFRSDFPLFDDPNVHFLDSAASSQKPLIVIDEMAEFAAHHYANVQRGAYRLAVEATDIFERARSRTASFIGGQPQNLILTRGATTSLNMIAFGWGAQHLRAGDTILATIMEHHANLVPWQMVARRTGATVRPIPITEDFRVDMEALEDLLDPSVRIVAVTGMSNVLGTIPDLERISASIRRTGALLVVDGAQLVAHRPVNVSELDIDFLAFSAHKMLGPTGIGGLWGRSERLEEMEPFEGGGEMISRVEFEHSTWTDIPHRFEAGTPPIIEAAGLLATIEYLESVGMATVKTHDSVLTQYAWDRLRSIDDLELYGPEPGDDRGGVISFTLGDAHPHDLATILDQRGVAIRAGHHCAEPITRYLGVSSTARASFHIYNNESDIDALVDGLEAAVRLFGI